MKKFLCKIILCATAVLAGFGFFAPVTASAEEGVESAVESVVIDEMDNVSSEVETDENDGIIVEETETSKWFDETIKPLLLQYGAEVLAFGTVVFIWLKKFRQSNTALGVAVGALTKSNEDNTNTAKAVEELKKQYTKEIAEIREETAKEIAELKSVVMDAIAELKESIADKVVDANDTLNKLLEVEKLAYGDNATLVSNGVAKRIAEVVGYGKTEYEK